MKKTCVEAAQLFLDRHFPDCAAAILSGSVIRGRETAYSDLDLVILDDTRERPFRACYEESGWPIEAFVLTSDSYPDLFAVNRYRGLPTLQRMCAFGWVLKDDGSAGELVRTAKAELEEGPFPWEEEDRRAGRYEITDCLMDLEGSDSREEDLFIVQRLCELVPEFVLRANRRWKGEGKWLYRALRDADETLCAAFVEAVRGFYEHGEKAGLIACVDQLLNPYGGRLFAGFRQEG